MTRITLDLDHMNQNKIRATAHILKYTYLSTNPIVMYRTSSSGRGGHILAYINEEIEEDMVYHLRYILGDHFHRICLDFNKPLDIPKQILFDYKRTNEKTIYSGAWQNV